LKTHLLVDFSDTTEVARDLIYRL